MIARFFSSDPSPKPSQFKTIVDWGDGETSTATVRKAKLVDQNEQEIDVPQLYDVIADHTYKRQGPYVITLQIQDTESRAGGLATSLAYAIDTTNEEDIERFVEDGKIDRENFNPKTDKQEDLKPYVLSGAKNPIGLPTFIEMDRGKGDFRSTAHGDIFFQYFFKMDTVDSGGQGAPSMSFGSDSSEASQEGDQERTFIDFLFASGKVDPINFDVGQFRLNTYEVAFEGMSSGPSKGEYERLGDKATTETESKTEFKEHKTYDQGEFHLDL